MRRPLVLVMLVACGGGTKKVEPPRDHDPELKSFINLAAGLAPGNIAVGLDGKVYFSLHQFYAPEIRVAQFDMAPQPIAEGAVDSVLGIRVDDRGLVWMLDNGMRNKTPRKLVSWDPKTQKVERTIELTSVTYADSFLNDLAVDRTHDAIYIADPAGGSNAAIIVVDLATNAAKRVLEGDVSVIPGKDDLIIDGKKIDAHIGINPIALDGQDEWLYFGPMHGTMLYRARTADLRAGKAQPEPYAKRPITDGISIDLSGNIYLGDLANNAIGYIKAADRSYDILVRDPRLSWVDAFSYGPDGYYYVVTNQLHRSAPLNGGKDASTPPYVIWKFKPLAPGRVGR